MELLFEFSPPTKHDICRFLARIVFLIWIKNVCVKIIFYGNSDFFFTAKYYFSRELHCSFLGFVDENKKVKLFSYWLTFYSKYYAVFWGFTSMVRYANIGHKKLIWSNIVIHRCNCTPPTCFVLLESNFKLPQISILGIIITKTEHLSNYFVIEN